MIISRYWLNSYIPNLLVESDENIAKSFNFLGFEVEQIKKGLSGNNFVYGQIIKVEPIENTHLKYCQVKISQSQIISIICGASNVINNIFVVVALPGAQLSNKKIITETKIKGFQSQGMLCGWEELGVNSEVLSLEEKTGIIILDPQELNNIPNNSNILTFLGLTDTLFFLDLTINRSDCWGAYQLANEIAHYFNYSINMLVESALNNKYDSLSLIKINSDKVIDVVAEVYEVNNNFCQTTSELVWLKNNEILAVKNQFSNYGLMTEILTAQPVYCFDYDKIKNLTINYSETLAGKKLVFENEGEIIGVIGQDIAKDFLPNENTKNVLVVMIHLNYYYMRQQLKQEQNTNHWYQRFTKPLSRELLVLAQQYLQNLLINKNIIKKVVFSQKKELKTLNLPIISVTLTEINKIIGHNFSEEQIKKLLLPLNFMVKKNKNNIDQLDITIPPVRTDIINKADIYEEIARLFGYDNIAMKPPIIAQQEQQQSQISNIINLFEICCLSWGINQVKTYSLTSEEDVNNFNFFNYQDNNKVLIPMSQEHYFLRKSLLYQLLLIGVYNNNRQCYENYFTVEKVYFSGNKSNYHGALIIQAKESLSFFKIKGQITNFFEQLGLDIVKIKYQLTDEYLVAHPYQTAKIYYCQKLIGVIGKIHPLFAKKRNLSDSYFCELNLSVLTDIISNQKWELKEISKFVSIKRDLSLLVPKKCLYDELTSIIFQKEPINYLINYELKDFYIGDQIPNNYQALTFSMEFNNNSKQLTDNDIKISYDQILKIIAISKIDIIVR